MPNGSQVPRGVTYECRGSTVNVFHGRDWYQLDLAGTFAVPREDVGPPRSAAVHHRGEARRG